MRTSSLPAWAARASPAVGTAPPHAPPAALPSMDGHNAQPVATSWSSQSCLDGGKAPRGDGINALFARPSTGTPPSSIHAAFHDKATGHHGCLAWESTRQGAGHGARPARQHKHAFPVRQPRTDALRRLSSPGHRDEIWRQPAACFYPVDGERVGWRYGARGLVLRRRGQGAAHQDAFLR